MQETPPRIYEQTLIFDGHCGFCTRWVLWIKKLDRNERLEIVPWQQLGVLDRFHLTRDDVRRAAWFFGTSGALSGAAAINAALDVALNCHLFTKVYRLRFSKTLQDATYQWIAANRRQLIGVRAYCKQHPEICEN